MAFLCRIPEKLRILLVGLLFVQLAGCAGLSSTGNGPGGNSGGGATAPAAPTGLLATAGNAEVSLTWSASSGATGYYVQRATVSGGPYVQIAVPATNSYANTGLTNGTTYYYVVSAFNSAGPSANSAQASATPSAPVTPPTAPAGLQATAGNMQVNLVWAASAGATSYHVKRATINGGPYTQVSAPTGTNFIDLGLANGTAYYYVVSALNSAGESANSSQVSATPVAPATPPAAPTGVQATAGNAQVNLSWSASTGATSYHVKRSTTSGGPYTQVAAPTTTSDTDSGLTNGTTYFYVVSALNAAGESANSSQASATPVGAAADVTITVNPAISKPISPYIYGINFYSGVTGAPPLLTMDRDGGDRWTAYNWINNASNAGSDYLYENDDYLCNGTCNASIPAEAVRLFISGDQSNNMASLVTLQMQGYVSIDTTVVQVPTPFPNLQYFRPAVDQKSAASSAPFTLTPPAASTDNNVYMDEFAWALDQDFLSANIFGASPTQPTFISLDNEPDLWNSTHQEVQGSTNVSSAAFVTKTVNLSTALKSLSKNAQTPASHFSDLVIFGPVNYGFEGIYSWQGDPTLSPTPNGANWFADKYLTGLHSASTAFGAPLVDVYDFHWYAEVYDSNGTRITDMTGTTLTDAQVRLIVQSPRDLWDTTWTDTGNSNPWIVETLGGQAINMLGRLQAKINAENPGMKLSITEYNNGGSNHIAGTIAQADNLGIFGAQGLFAASLWPLDSAQPYILGGFRAYRGFDGANACFGDTSLQAASSNVGNVMVYASTDSTTPGRTVFVAINRSTSAQVTAINGATLSGTAHLYQMTAASAQGQNPVAPVSIGTMAVSGSSLTISLPALSVTTIDVH